MLRLRETTQTRQHVQNTSNYSAVLLHVHYSESACLVRTGYLFFGTPVSMQKSNMQGQQGVQLLGNKVHIQGMTVLADNVHKQEPIRKWIRFTQSLLHTCTSNLVCELCQQATPACLISARNLIPRLTLCCLCTHGKVASDIRQTDFFSAMTDLWSSNTLDSYISYTIHFIGEDWELHSSYLQTDYDMS